jgi:hypothetical protein
MEENYIHIFSVFVAELLEQGKLEVKDAYFLMSEFEPVCEDVQNRQALVSFLEEYIPKFGELKELKRQLLDSNHIFKQDDNGT